MCPLETFVAINMGSLLLSLVVYYEADSSDPSWGVSSALFTCRAVVMLCGSCLSPYVLEREEQLS